MLEEAFTESGGPSVTHSALRTGSPGGRPSLLCLQGGPPQTSRVAVPPGASLPAAPGLGPPRDSDLFGGV